MSTRKIYHLRVLLVSMGLLWCSFWSYSQEIMLKEVKLEANCILTVRHDLVLPSSLKVFNQDTSYLFESFKIDGRKLIFNECPKDSVFTVLYRGVNLDINKVFTALDDGNYRKIDPLSRVYDFGENVKDKDNIVSSNELNYAGSFSRGFAIGNSQSLVLNSNFDLQMNGDIGNGIKVIAAISDDNIPIQPEGNTQVLQEFDKVFIEVSKDRTSVIAGDYEIRRPVSYFMNFQKKLKGLNIQNISIIDDKKSINTAASIASSRGKFARQILPTREGNQGPYRLVGNTNERFIIVLSGQEKVYFNGELMRRGLEYDYVIDYNSAEIVFTAKRLIAKESRVIIEFEYTDLNYFRSLYHIRNDFNAPRYNINLNFYSEQDSKNSTSQIELDSTDISILTQSGDAQDLSARNGVRRLVNNEINTSNVTYRYVPNPDFPNDGIPQYLQYSTDASFDLYVATFSEVGVGQGAYDIDTRQGVNGRVYTFVGKNKGKYEPIAQLVAPERKQMATVSATFRLAKKTELRGEWSLTNIDKNLFSVVNDNDNVGQGGYFELVTEKRLDSLRQISIYGSAKVERLSSYFNPLNPYRNAEFVRDWNIDSLSLANQTISELIGGIRLRKSELSYQFSSFTSTNIYNGTRHLIKANINDFGWSGYAQLGLTNTSFLGRNTRFIRPNFDLKRTIQKIDALTFGVALEAENNAFRELTTELNNRSYAFNYWRYYMKSNEQRPLYFTVSYNKRNDDFAKFGTLQRTLDINEIEVNAAWQIQENHRLDFNIKQRDFEVLRSDLAPSETSKNTLVGYVDHTLGLKGFSINTNYQIASGQEPKLEFVFQKLENNFGEYVYVGNDTSTTKNITDFRYDPSNPLARYIRIALPNNEFISTNQLALNHSIRIQPSQIFDPANKSKLVAFTKKFENLLTYRNNLKTNANTAERDINPLQRLDTLNTVSYNGLFTNNLFINKGNARFDIVWILRDNGLLQNQLNGNENRTLKENELRTRVRIAKSADWLSSLARGDKTFDAQLFKDRNFVIEYNKIQNELNIRQGTSLRYIIRHKFENRNQILNTNFNAKVNDFSGVINWRQASKSALDLSISFVEIQYDGPLGLSLEYDMLDGLKPGNNILWNGNFTRRLNGVVDLTVSYEGRRTGQNPAIHIARAQVKASF